MSNKYKLSDNVIARIAQGLQESLLMGTDVVDSFRQIEVEVAPDGVTLDLTPEYTKRVKASHDQLLEEIETLQANSNKSKIIFNA